MSDFESLLFKDSYLEKYQNKWTKDLSEGHIKVLNQMYTLKVTDNKRELVFENNKLINTIPFKMNK
jgi:hypothetical protein